MLKILFFLVSFSCFLRESLRGQCPDRDILWKRILYLRDSAKVTPKEQLSELLGYLDKMNNCPYRNDSTHAYLFRRIGTLYFVESDYLKSLQYYRQFINILAANAGKPTVNMKHLVAGYYWISVIYDSLNMRTEKWKALDNCANIAEKIGYIDRASLFSLYKRMVYFFDIGDYYRCADYAMRCETLGKEYANTGSVDENKVGLEYTLTSLLIRIDALMILKDYHLAEELLFNKVDEFKKAGFIEYSGIIYEQLAKVEEHKGNYEKALGFLNQALQFHKEQGYDFAYKKILNTIGLDIYYYHFKDYDKALVYYRKAYKFATKDESAKKEDAFETLSILTNIANVYVQKGLYDSAFHYFKLALDQIKPGVNESDIVYGSPNDFIQQEKIYYRINLLIDKGNAYRQLYGVTKQASAIQEALDVYKITDQLLDRIKIGLTEFQSKLFWRNYSRRLYENAIEACYMNNDATNAFYFFEKSRAVLLYDQLNEKRWMGEKDILNQTELQKKILHIERDFNTTDKNSVRYNELQRALFILKHELDTLQQQIKTRNPLYYQNFLDTSFITIDDVRRKILNDHEAVIELFVGDRAVYLLIITSQQNKLVKIDKEDFDRLSSEYTRYISAADLINNNFEVFKKISGSLYQLIFKTISLPKGRIVISTDGQYFPFEALVTSKPGEPVTYFLKDYAVSYTYSARYLLNSFVAKSDSVSHDFLGVAPLQFSSSKQLPALPGSDQSLQRLQSYFANYYNLVGENASKKNFTEQFSRYRIIQMYTHATDSGYNSEPMIYFADSPLLLSDLIYEKNPLTYLIVLSACETGKGKVYHGEGVFSFNRGFAALGIPSSITNLWVVNTKPTYRLTELFYKYLTKGLPIDVALQKAKIEFIETAFSKEDELPFYWAAPVLAGKTDPIVFKKDFRLIYLLASACLITLAFVGYRSWKERKNFNGTMGRRKSAA